MLEPLRRSLPPLLRSARRLAWTLTLLACVVPTLAQERRPLSGHIPALAKASALVGALPGDERLLVTLGLPLRNEAELDRFLQDLVDPSSPRFRRYLTPQEFSERFGASAADHAEVRRFAERNGLKVVEDASSHSLVVLEGAVRDIERTFQVELRRYRRPQGGTFHAPDREPSLELSVPIRHISGLENHLVPRPASLSPKPGPLPAAGSGVGGSYLGYDFRTAYLPCLASDVDGAGQTIALLQFSDYFASDITKYITLSGLPTPTSIQKIQVTGSITTDDNAEVSLDISMALCMAPRAALLIYEHCNTCFNDPNVMLQRIASDNKARQISSSWTGFGDANTVNIFKQYAAQGQSFFQASGDQGAYWSSGYYTSAPPPITTSPLMTVVGGTRLTTDASVAYQSEITWNRLNDPSIPSGYYAASGGGILDDANPVPIPTYQVPFATNSASSVYRNIPDVSLTAEECLIYYDNGTLGAFGGTSAAAPLWAGVMALVNQQAHAAGRGSIGNANPPLYTLALNASDYAAYYHDITTGHNNYDGTNPAYYPAGTKFDLATGLGSPRCELVAALAALAPTATPPPIYYPPGTYPTAVPQVISSPVLAPVPLSRAGSFCLHNIAPSATTRLEFFNPTGTLVAVKTSSDATPQCWEAHDLPPGLYWVRVRTQDRSGREWSANQKVLVRP